MSAIDLMLAERQMQKAALILEAMQVDRCVEFACFMIGARLRWLAS